MGKKKKTDIKIPHVQYASRIDNISGFQRQSLDVSQSRLNITEINGAKRPTSQYLTIHATENRDQLIKQKSFYQHCAISAGPQNGEGWGEGVGGLINRVNNWPSV